MRCPSATCFLCAALTTWSLLSLGLEVSQGAPDAPLPEPLLAQGILPPEAADGPFRYWSARKKYFLVVAVNQTDVPQTELPFAQVDGQQVVTTLMGLGYQPLDPAHPLLTGKEATASAIVASVRKATPKNKDATLIIYYTGHGAVGAKDLWLQTAGLVELGDTQGLAVSDLIRRIRFTASDTGPKPAFEGELVLILDACYSGQGTVSQGLTLGEAGKRTTILTSSSNIQASFILTPPHVPKPMSAFTYSVLQAVGPEWAQADLDHDGMLRWEEVKLAVRQQLRAFKTRGAVPSLMEPEMFSNYSEGFLAYRRDQVRVWRSSYRDELTTQAMEDVLAAHLQTLDSRSKDRPAVPKDAQLLAQTFEPAADNYYAQGVKATAEGQVEQARALFAKADAQSQTRATQADAAKQRETEKQGQIAFARARLEIYAGRFTEAFRQYQLATRLAPPTTFELINEIGVAGLRAGQYAEAAPYLTRALTQREQALPPDHPDVAVSLNNLAVLYDTQGKYAEAEPLYQRALRIDEAAHGPNHPNVGRDLNNLASLYDNQGKYAEAEPLYQRSFWIVRNGLGAEHPTVGKSLANYQALLKATGQPYNEQEAWDKLRSSKYAPTSPTRSP